MSILTRYISREFAKLLLLCLVTFVFLYLLVDFIEQSNSFFRHDASIRHVLSYFAYKVPLILFQMLPVAVLLATLLTLTLLSRNSEIIAMKSGGVSIYRIVAPLLVLAALLSGFTFLLNEYVVPFTTERAEYIKRVEIKGRQPAVRKKRKNIWYKTASGIYYIRVYHTERREMRDLSFFDFDRDFNLLRRIDAEGAVWIEGDGQWEFRSGVIREFRGGDLVANTPFDTRRIPIPETPEDFSTVAKRSDEMNYRELSEYIRRVEGEGLDVTRHQVDLQGKLSFPLVGLVMALLAIPFGLRGGRQGGVALGIAMAVSIGVVYWLFLGTFLSLGNSGSLPPMVAAWGSHAIFGVLGVIMLLRVPK